MQQKQILKNTAGVDTSSFATKVGLARLKSNEFEYLDLQEVSLKGNKYDFSVDYQAIDKSNILSIHKYLMTKNNI